MLDAVAQASAQLHYHCNGDPSSMPVNDVLDGIRRLPIWAVGFPCPVGFWQLPVRQKGLHVGTGLPVALPCQEGGVGLLAAIHQFSTVLYINAFSCQTILG